MAATGFTPIQLYRTSTAAAVPTSGNLADGELAINLTDEILYFKNAAGTVKFLSANITPIANGGTGATAAPAARTNLGATTLGANLFTVTNPSAVTFPRFNADNTVSTLDAATFRTAIGAGTGGGSVTSVALSGGTTGLTASGSPITTSGTITLAGTLAVANGGTGLTTLTANNVVLGNGTSTPLFVAPGTSGNVLTSNGTTWTSAAAGASLSGVTQSVSPFETALGFEAGLNTTGVNNTFTGYQAGRANTSGANNTAIGTSALLLNTTGSDNTAVGRVALDANTTGNRNTTVGSESLSAATTAEDNSAFGYQALNANTTGSFNAAFGSGALAANTTAGSNSAFGRLALSLNTTGANNTGVGFFALYANTTGTKNVAMGSNALGANTTAQDNSAFGNQALRLTTTGSGNCAFGANALDANNIGTYNIAVGYYSLFSNTSGNSNTAIGTTSLGGVTTGTRNTAIGENSGYSGTNNLTTGSNNIIIGYNAAASSATVSNEVTLGNASITSTRLRGMVELNAAMFEAANISATAATGTINFDARTQSVLYYTSNASGNWTLNIRAASGVSLDSVMTTGESMTVAFLVTNGATAFYQTGFQVDGSSVTPKWQGGAAPAAGNASSIDTYVITVIKTGAATFVVLASQTRFA